MLDKPRDIGRGDDGPVADADNPEWSAADFARAARGNEIPAAIRAAFDGQGRAIRADDPPVEVSLAVSPHVVAYFRAQGEDWRERMSAALLQHMLAELRNG